MWMSFEELTARFGLYLGSFVIGLVSGLIPVVNSEIYLLAVSSVAARPGLLPIAVLTALGQMASKSILFYAGKGVIKIPTRKYEKKMDAVKQKFLEWRGRTDLLILVSAFVGFPPLYVVSVVAGAINLNFPRFFAAGLVGRVVRFAVVVFFPQLVKGLLDANPDTG